MESKTEMLARHARELDELESRWWEEWFTEDPIASARYVIMWARNGETCGELWIKTILPTIIRKREKIGVTISRHDGVAVIAWDRLRAERIPFNVAEKLAGRTLAPGEKVEI